MSERIKEILVTVGQDTKLFQVTACQCGLDDKGRFKFSVKVKQAGIFKDKGFVRATSYTIAAQTVYHKIF